MNKDHEENALKRDLVIHGLAKVVRQKEKEVVEFVVLNCAVFGIKLSIDC